jgi:hypothetical protein
MGERFVLPLPAARLLNKKQAAAYCNVALSTFDSVCPVPGIAMDRLGRVVRYDVHALDRWIDRLGQINPASAKTKEDRLAEF